MRRSSQKRGCSPVGHTPSTPTTREASPWVHYTAHRTPSRRTHNEEVYGRLHTHSHGLTTLTVLPYPYTQASCSRSTTASQRAHLCSEHFQSPVGTWESDQDPQRYTYLREADTLGMKRSVAVVATHESPAIPADSTHLQRLSGHSSERLTSMFTSHAEHG